MTPSSFSRSVRVALTISPFFILTPPAIPSFISLPRTVPVPRGPKSISAKFEPTSMTVPWRTSPLLGTSIGCAARRRPISESSSVSSVSRIFFGSFAFFVEISRVSAPIFSCSCFVSGAVTSSATVAFFTGAFLVEVFFLRDDSFGSASPSSDSSGFLWSARVSSRSELKVFLSDIIFFFCGRARAVRVIN